jgi:hypothetical protein
VLCHQTRGCFQSLVWDSNCGINLANYLTNRKEKIAVFAKGCDSRNIVNHIIENKIKRDQVHIVGVPCTGMIDKRKITGMVRAKSWRCPKPTPRSRSKPPMPKPFDKAEVLQQNCALCIHRNPVIHDEMVADPVEEQTDIDRYADIREDRGNGQRGKMAVFRGPAVTVHPLLRLPQCLPAVLLPHLFRGRIQAPVGRQGPGPHRRKRPSIFCGPTTAPAAAPTAVPANGPARWASTCGC